MSSALSENYIKEKILEFSQYLVSAAVEPDCQVVARRRDWIDPAGAPTDAGRSLVHALRDQRQTVGVFASLF